MTRKLTQEYVKEYIEKEGYKLLSDYINARTKITVSCPKGHIRDIKFHNFKNGGRCLDCFKKYINKHTIEYVKEYIENIEGYKLLSKEYNNKDDILEIECPKGHRCDKPFNSFRNGTRCAICINNNIKYTIEQVREFIEVDGYKLLSKEYNGKASILEIECPKGHRCDKRLEAFKNSGQRCKDCFLENKNKSEDCARNIIEKIFEKPFPSIRPVWLKNPKTNRKLELDIYNKELKLAFEYNGIQHYQPHRFFKRTDDSFEKQQANDKLKQELCKQHGIKLIIIPYEYDFTDPEKMKTFIIKSLEL